MVPVDTREHIKQLLLSNLVSPNMVVMRSGANVIAQIASIEIARREWLGIVASLADNSMHEEVNIRRASITTLGFICEELKNVETIVDGQVCEQILGSLLICIRENSDIVEIALNALRDSVPFLRHILVNEQFCMQFFEIVLPYMATGYRSKVYEILFEFGRHCYPMLGGNIGSIAVATVAHID
jgi:importin subunit beta-1